MQPRSPTSWWAAGGFDEEEFAREASALASAVAAGPTPGPPPRGAVEHTVAAQSEVVGFSDRLEQASGDDPSPPASGIEGHLRTPDSGVQGGQGGSTSSGEAASSISPDVAAPTLQSEGRVRSVYNNLQFDAEVSSEGEADSVSGGTDPAAADTDDCGGDRAEAEAASRPSGASGDGEATAAPRPAVGAATLVLMAAAAQSARTVASANTMLAGFTHGVEEDVEALRDHRHAIADGAAAAAKAAAADEVNVDSSSDEEGARAQSRSRSLQEQMKMAGEAGEEERALLVAITEAREQRVLSQRELRADAYEQAGELARRKKEATAGEDKENVGQGRRHKRPKCEHDTVVEASVLGAAIEDSEDADLAADSGGEVLSTEVSAAIARAELADADRQLRAAQAERDAVTSEVRDLHSTRSRLLDECTALRRLGAHERGVVSTSALAPEDCVEQDLVDARGRDACTGTDPVRSADACSQCDVDDSCMTGATTGGVECSARGPQSPVTSEASSEAALDSLQAEIDAADASLTHLRAKEAEQRETIVGLDRMIATMHMEHERLSAALSHESGPHQTPATCVDVALDAWPLVEGRRALVPDHELSQVNTSVQTSDAKESACAPSTCDVAVDALPLPVLTTPTEEASAVVDADVVVAEARADAAAALAEVASLRRTHASELALQKAEFAEERATASARVESAMARKEAELRACIAERDSLRASVDDTSALHAELEACHQRMKADSLEVSARVTALAMVSSAVRDKHVAQAVADTENALAAAKMEAVDAVRDRDLAVQLQKTADRRAAEAVACAEGMQSQLHVAQTELAALRAVGFASHSKLETAEAVLGAAHDKMAGLRQNESEAIMRLQAAEKGLAAAKEEVHSLRMANESAETRLAKLEQDLSRARQEARTCKEEENKARARAADAEAEVVRVQGCDVRSMHGDALDRVAEAESAAAASVRKLRIATAGEDEALRRATEAEERLATARRQVEAAEEAAASALEKCMRAERGREAAINEARAAAAATERIRRRRQADKTASSEREGAAFAEIQDLRAKLEAALDRAAVIEEDARLYASGAVDSGDGGACRADEVITPRLSRELEQRRELSQKRRALTHDFVELQHEESRAVRDSMEAEFKARLAEVVTKHRSAAKEGASKHKAAIEKMRARLASAERQRDELELTLTLAQEALDREKEAALTAQRHAEAAELAAARAERAQDAVTSGVEADGARTETTLEHVQDAMDVLEARLQEAEARATQAEAHIESVEEQAHAHERARLEAESNAKGLQVRAGIAAEQAKAAEGRADELQQRLDVLSAREKLATASTVGAPPESVAVAYDGGPSNGSVAQLVQELAVARAEVVRLQAERADLEKAVNEATTAAAALSAQQIAATEHAVAEATEAERRKASVTLQEAAAELEATKASEAAADARATEYESALAGARAEVERLGAMLQASQEEVESLRVQLKEAIAQDMRASAEAEASLRAAKVEAAEALAALDCSDAEVLDLRSKLTAATAAASDARVEADELSQQLESARQAADDARVTAADTLAEAASWCESAAAEAQLRGEVARLNGQLEDAEVEARQGSERATELSVELDDVRARAHGIEEELARAKGELKRTEVTKERAEAEKRRAQDELTRMQAAEDGLQCSLAQACAAKEAAESEQKRIRIELDQALSARDDAVGRVTVLEAEVMRLSIECNEAMDAKGERARALVEQQALQADLHLANQASESLKSDLLEIRERERKLLGEISALHTQGAEARSAASEQHAELVRERNEAIDAATATLETLRYERARCSALRASYLRRGGAIRRRLRMELRSACDEALAARQAIAVADSISSKAERAARDAEDAQRALSAELASVREARDEAAAQADVALRRLERANKSHDKALQGLHQRLTKADADLRAANRAAEIARDDSARLAREAQDAQSLATAANDARASSDQMAGEARQRAEEAEARLAQAEAASVQAHAEVASLRLRVEELENSLLRADSEAETLRESLSHTKAQLARVQNDAAAMVADASEAAQQAATEMQEMSLRAEDRLHALEREQELEVSDLRKSIASLRDERARTKTALARAMEEIEEQKRTNAAAVATLHERVHVSATQVAASKAEVRAIERRVAEAQADARDRRRAAAEAVAAAKARLDHEREGAKAAASEAEEQVAALRQKCDELEKQIAQQVAEHVALNEAYSNEVARAEDAVAAASEAEARHSVELSVASATAKEAEAAVEAAVGDAAVERKELRAELEGAQASLEESRAALATARQDVAAAEASRERERAAHEASRLALEEALEQARASAAEEHARAKTQLDNIGRRLSIAKLATDAERGDLEQRLAEALEAANRHVETSDVAVLTDVCTLATADVPPDARDANLSVSTNAVGVGTEGRDAVLVGTVTRGTAMPPAPTLVNAGSHTVATAVADIGVSTDAVDRTDAGADARVVEMVSRGMDARSLAASVKNVGTDAPEATKMANALIGTVAVEVASTGSETDVVKRSVAATATDPPPLSTDEAVQVDIGAARDEERAARSAELERMLLAKARESAAASRQLATMESRLAAAHGILSHARAKLTKPKLQAAGTQTPGPPTRPSTDATPVHALVQVGAPSTPTVDTAEVERLRATIASVREQALAVQEVDADGTNLLAELSSVAASAATSPLVPTTRARSAGSVVGTPASAGGSATGRVRDGVRWSARFTPAQQPQPEAQAQGENDHGQRTPPRQHLPAVAPTLASAAEASVSKLRTALRRAVGDD